MDRNRCPACGSRYNGRKCSACLYVPMKDDMAFERNNRGVEFPREHSPRTHRSLGIVAVVAALATFLPLAANVALNAVEGVRQVMTPEPEPQALVLPDIEIPDIAITEIEIPDALSDFVVTDSDPYSQSAENAVQMPVEGTVLYDADDVLIVADWREGEPFPGDLPVYIQNASRNDISVTNNNAYINGYLMESAVVFSEVQAGQTVCDYLWQDIEGMRSAGIETVAQMIFRLEILDMDTYTFLEESDEIALEFEVPGDFVQPVNDSGQVLLDEGGVKVVCQGYGSVNGWNNTVQFFFENQTDRDIVFAMSGMYLNGKYVDCINYMTLPAGTRAVNDMFLFFYLEEQGVRDRSDVRSLEVKLAVQDGESYAIVYDLGCVGLDLGD